MYYLTNYNSPIGKLTIASDGINIKGLWLENQKYFMKSIKEETQVNDNLKIFIEAKKWLDKYFNGENPNIKELSLSLDGSDFRLDVWKLLSEIPYGKVITYGDISKKLAIIYNKKNMSSQAVGGAVGHNPISILIPCHRVIGSNKSLTGYAGGIDKKIKLLELEGIDTSKLKIPTKGTAL